MWEQQRMKFLGSTLYKPSGQFLPSFTNEVLSLPIEDRVQRVGKGGMSERYLVTVVNWGTDGGRVSGLC